MVIMKTALRFSSRFSMAFYYVEDICYIKYSFTFFFSCYDWRCWGPNPRIKKWGDVDFLRADTKSLEVSGIVLSFASHSGKSDFKDFKPYRALVQGKRLQDSVSYLQPRYMGKKIRIFITNINLSTLCIIEGITPKYSVEISRSFQKSQAHKNLKVSLSSTSPFPPDRPNSLIILFKYLWSLIFCVSCSQTDTPIPYGGTHDQSQVYFWKG